MELRDRYLEAVRKHLPWRGQDDILAELKANLESQLDEKESELSRSLKNEEAEAWLKELGPPIQMAGRYQRQQFLIGPAVFPVYWYILRLTLVWCSTIYILAKIRGDRHKRTRHWPGVRRVVESALGFAHRRGNCHVHFRRYRTSGRALRSEILLCHHRSGLGERYAVAVRAWTG